MLSKFPIITLKYSTINLYKYYISLLFIILIQIIFQKSVQAQKNDLSEMNKLLYESKTDSSRINIMIKISNYYFSRNVDSSLVYAKKAYNLSKNNKNYKLPEAAKSIGNSYSLEGDFDKAIEYEIEAYNVAKKQNVEKLYAPILCDIGSDYLMLNDNEMAMKYLNEALKVCVDYRGYVVTLANIAQVYAGTDRYTEAHGNYDRALQMAQKENNIRDMAIIYNRKGNLYLMEEQYDKSLAYYEKSIKMLDTTDLYYIVCGLRGIIENHIVSRRYNKGLEVAKIADSLARKGGFMSEAKLINLFTSELYDSLRNYSKSLYYYRIYYALNDSLFNLEKSKRMNFLQTDFETKQKEMELNLLKDKAVLNKRLSIIYLLVCTLIIVVLFLLLKNIRQKNKILLIEKEKNILEKQKLEFDLHEKNREILTHSMQIHQQKEVFSNINSKLITILRLEDPDKIKNSVNHLNSEVKKSMDLSDDWDQIKIHFDKVHPDFFHTLKKDYPDLSVNELKLCAYTKLKFSNKEISRLFNINSSSVHIARYRLKKKMNMPEEINFDEYILKRIIQ